MKISINQPYGYTQIGQRKGQQAVKTFSAGRKNFLGRKNSNKKGRTLRRKYYIDKEQTLSI